MRQLGPVLVIAGISLAACSEGTGPGGVGGQPQFSRQITFDEFTGIITDGATRAEIELVRSSLGGGPLVADEVELKGADEMTDEENIESPVTALEVAGSTGTLTLKLGAITVEFTTDTRFEDERDARLTFSEFVERVRAALDAGREPAIEAERDPTMTPQAPDDGTFVAAEIKLDDEADEPELELNIDGDNVGPCEANAPAGCLAVLRVLGVSILLLSDETELKAEVEDLRGEVDFEGVVAAVDRAGSSCRLGTVTFTDGTVVRLVEGTEIENQSGDDDQLDDLCEVEEALEEGQIVEADGEGVVEGSDPLTIVAIEVEFEREDEAEDVAGEVRFEARVSAVAFAEGSSTLGSVTLVGGTIVQVVAGTDIDDDSGNGDQLRSLSQVQAALESGQMVVAQGDGGLVSTDPRTVVASRVRFRIES